MPLWKKYVVFVGVSLRTGQVIVAQLTAV